MDRARAYCAGNLRHTAPLCRRCQHSFTSDNYETQCPKCGVADTMLVAGEELDIAFIETEDA